MILGQYGQMVSLRGTEIVATPITKEMEDQRLINLETDQLVKAARTTGIVFGDEM